MKITANLFIDQWGSLRITKGSTRCKPTEQHEVIGNIYENPELLEVK